MRTLLPTGARITVVAPQFDPEFNRLVDPSTTPGGFAQDDTKENVIASLEGAKQSMVSMVPRAYTSDDLRGVFMVFICTDKPAVNAQVSNDARARRILVNNACDYLDGDFIVPARMDFGENIAVTVSTQGRAPSLAKKLKQKIQAEWGDELSKIEQESNLRPSNT